MLAGVSFEARHKTHSNGFGCDSDGNSDAGVALRRSDTSVIVCI